MYPTYMNITQRVVTLPAGVSTVVAPAVSIGRHYLAIQNTGADNATINFDAVAVVGQGWTLFAAGGGLLWANGEGAPTNQIRAVSSAGTTLIVLEG